MTWVRPYWPAAVAASLGVLAILSSCATTPDAVRSGPRGVAEAPSAVPVPAGATCPSPGGPFTSGQAQAFGDITLPCLRSGSSIALNHLTGQRPVLVNLWASWCRPCQREMPRLERVARLARARLLVLGVDTLDTTGSARSFLRAIRSTYPQLSDPSGRVRTAIHAVGLPGTLLLTADGAVAFRKLGELSAGDLVTALQRIGIAITTNQINGTRA